LHVASYLGHEEFVRVLLEHGADVNALDKDKKRSPLLCSIGSEKVEIVRMILKKGAKVNQVDSEGYTALHEASMRGNGPIVKELLDYGADRSLKTSKGKTPLELAKENGHEKLAAILVTRS
jgi:ankyrin repeat protein